MTPAEATALRRLAGDGPPRARSLLATAYGDVIWPRGGRVWIGGLIRLAELFGINGRAVRTAVHRLVREDWLAPVRDGRHTDYRLTSHGAHQCAAASARIHAGPHGARWDGAWQAVLLPPLPATDRKRVWDECGWRGFARFGNRLLLRPAAGGDLDDALRDLGLTGKAAVFTASSTSERALAALVRAEWDLAALERSYAAFLRRFAPLVNHLRRGPPSPDFALGARLALVDGYRRVLLKDPLLPTALLPRQWHGAEAWRMCAGAYRELAPHAEDCASVTLGAASRPLAPAADDVAGRFRTPSTTKENG